MPKSLSLVVVWENVEAFDDTKAMNLTTLLCHQLAQCAQTRKCEILIVHNPNAGTSKSAKILTKHLQDQFSNAFEVREIECSAGGYVDQKAAGIENSKHDVVVFADCDCRLENNWLEEIIRPFEDDQIDIVHGNVCIEPNDLWTTAATIFWFYPICAHCPEKPYWIYFCSLAIRRSVYKVIPFPGKPGGDRSGCIIWPAEVLENDAVTTVAIGVKTYHPAPAESISDIARHAWTEGILKQCANFQIHSEGNNRLKLSLRQIGAQILHIAKRIPEVWGLQQMPRGIIILALCVAVLHFSVASTSLIYALIFRKFDKMQKHDVSVFE